MEHVEKDSTSVTQESDRLKNTKDADINAMRTMAANDADKAVAAFKRAASAASGSKDGNSVAIPKFTS